MTSLTSRLVRLADHLAELRLRLQEATREEVAHAIAEALADATRSLIAGRAAGTGTGRAAAAYESSPEWDDPWSETMSYTVASGDEELPTDKEPFRYEAALASALAVARWSLVRTGQPITAIGLAATVLIVLLVTRDRLKPLADVASLARELLNFPKRSI